MNPQSYPTFLLVNPTQLAPISTTRAFSPEFFPSSSPLRTSPQVSQSSTKKLRAIVGNSLNSRPQGLQIQLRPHPLFSLSFCCRRRALFLSKVNLSAYLMDPFPITFSRTISSFFSICILSLLAGSFLLAFKHIQSFCILRKISPNPDPFCSIKVVRVVILVLFLILEEKLSPFHC